MAESSPFKTVTNGDRNRLARVMWQADGEPEHSGPTTVGRSDYENDAHRVLQAAIDAGWKIEVPVGWRTRESG